MDAVIAYLFMMLICFVILVALSRWIFRINHIVDRLDKIINLLKVPTVALEDKPMEPAGEKHKCSQCGYVFTGDFKPSEGWWCPKCQQTRHY